MAQEKTFVSIVIPCYNEEAILPGNLDVIISYMKEREAKFRWEIVIINDGSKDKTGEIADSFAEQYAQIRAIHHPVNLNLGNAMQSGFRHSKGDVIVVMDVDLSYGVEYIEKMVDKLNEAVADVVIASPYMEGGKVTAVPLLRKVMSKWVNRFMRMAAQDKYHTFTGMVRAYRRDYILNVNLKTKDYEVMPEIMYKSMILRARIIEIPAHLDWTEQNKFAGKRTSSMKIIRSTISSLMSSFIFRPYLFFVIIGFFLLALSMYQLVWLLYDTLSALPAINSMSPKIDYPFSYSLALQFKKNPQSFLVGGITFVASIQFLSLGFISLQNKRYFEELFHLGTSIRKNTDKQIQQM
jgi:glycosyltransferase involved in cell wall biosynthesis